MFMMLFILLTGADSPAVFIPTPVVMVHKLIADNVVLRYPWCDGGNLLYGVERVGNDNYDYLMTFDKKYYKLCYNIKFKIPEWVAYYVSGSDLKAKNTKRKNSFRSDPDIPVEFRSEVDDYDKSGYDRGHNAPADDFMRSEEAMTSTFLMSNMSPMLPKINRGVWKSLEFKIRKRIIACKKGWVITGNIVEQDYIPVKIDPGSDLVYRVSYKRGCHWVGDNFVYIPKYLYKVVLFDSSGIMSCWAYLIPNTPNPGKLENYKVSVDFIEKITGYDFFYLLPDSIEDRIEKWQR